MIKYSIDSWIFKENTASWCRGIRSGNICVQHAATLLNVIALHWARTLMIPFSHGLLVQKSGKFYIFKDSRRQNFFGSVSKMQHMT